MSTPNFFTEMPLVVPDLKPDEFNRDIYIRTMNDFQPVVLDSRRIIVSMTGEDLLRETIELIDEIELRFCNEDLDKMYRDIGGEG